MKMGSKRFLCLLAVMTAICCVVVVLFAFKDMPPYENTAVLVSAASISSSSPVSSASASSGAAGSTKKGASSAAKSSSSATTVININTADATTLASLPGIGDALSQRIIDYRTAHGPFTSISQLDNVKGIGAKKLAALNGLITL